MKTNVIIQNFNVIVVGGGLSGICAAIASARHGATTALVQDRPALGGNAGSEMKMHICGASCGGSKKNLRETGIIEEILLENRRRNPAKSFYVFDTILWEKVNFQDNLTLFLNTRVTDCKSFGNDEINGSIKYITALQTTTEKEFKFFADYFVDATGDGFLSQCAGAETITGRESRFAYFEENAQDIADEVTLGSTLMFKALDMGKPVQYIKPEWAYTFSEDDLKLRQHSAFENDMEIYNIDSGFWWIELGGNIGLHTIKDAEKIRDELLKILHGVWDHIKNGGDHGAQNYSLDWVQLLPSKRESRRIIGQYVLTQNDILNKTCFYDAVAYGGWPMDVHAEGGIWNKDEYPTDFIKFDGCYSIPYRCYLTKNIQNLFVVGRIISASHIAFGSTRVMATCAIGGQAIGTAAALSLKSKCMPITLLDNIKELQQILLKDDCYIPGIMNEDNEDMAKRAKVSAYFEEPPFYADNIINGISRNTKNSINCYQSDLVSKNDNAWIMLELQKTSTVFEIHIKFDSNLSNVRQLQISLDKSIQDIPFCSNIEDIVKDYDIVLLKEDKTIKTINVHDNYLRFVKHNLGEGVNINTVIINIRATNGAEKARIFEVRIY